MAATTDMRMPGVYTQEIATLPPSVPAIATAVPAFIGYTEMAVKKGEDLTLLPTRIKSLKEYTDWFGGDAMASITVSVDTTASATNPEVLVTSSVLPFKMYDSLQFYFANGGGPCYIVSVGSYDDTPDDAAMLKALAPMKKVRDITILYFPDGYGTLTDAKYGSVISGALQHCATMTNRVTIIDLNDSYGEDLDGIKGFLDKFPVDIDLKKYGAVYGPSLDTVFTATYDPDQVIISNHIQTIPAADSAATAGLSALSDDLAKKLTALNGAKDSLKTLQQTAAQLLALKQVLDNYKATHTNPAPTSGDLKTALFSSGLPIPPAVNTALGQQNPDPVKIVGDAITQSGTDITTAQGALTTAQGNWTTSLGTAKAGVVVNGNTYISFTGMNMSTVAAISNLIYNAIILAIRNYGLVLPPGGAVAGIYFRTDASQGVWKAPANVSVVSAISPMVDYDDDDHAELNVPDSGKAVNLIRNYPGRGVLVYGARTLAGNDNEWRYVNVRRTFCYIEDSIYRGMQDFVFAENNEETWIKVRAMINAFLNKLWKAGGLYGATPEASYQVTAGVPDTMSIDDMLNGFMIVYIKVAIARPAEFIVLRYEHKFDVPQS